MRRTGGNGQQDAPGKVMQCPFLVHDLLEQPPELRDGVVASAPPSNHEGQGLDDHLLGKPAVCQQAHEFNIKLLPAEAAGGQQTLQVVPYLH